MRIGVAMEGKGNLLEVVCTLQTGGGPPHPSDAGQKQADEYRADRDDHQGLKKGDGFSVETTLSRHVMTPNEEGTLATIWRSTASPNRRCMPWHIKSSFFRAAAYRSRRLSVCIAGSSGGAIP